MNLMIVGSGNVGQALGRAWKAAEHQITFAVRDPSAAKAANLRNNGFGVTAVSAAASEAKIILLAVPWTEIADVVGSLGSHDGKIVIDATNPLTKELELAVGFEDSAGETVQRLAKGANVVKAFNTTGAENMDRARQFSSKPVMFVASDASDAKKVVLALASDIGFESIDAGPLKASRLLEPMAMQWIKLAFGGLGTQFAFGIVRR